LAATTGIKGLATSLLAIELITGQKGILTTTKHSNIFLKIRKGNPAGCKVTLRKENMFSFS
jgi:large subunit ribosomal protein L5